MYYEVFLIASSSDSSSELTTKGEREMQDLLRVINDGTEAGDESAENDSGMKFLEKQIEQTIELSTSDPKKPRPQEMSLKDVRRLVLNSQYSQARVVLVERLKHSPREAESWDLLAIFLRKAGDWSGAIESFERVIEYGSADQANRARFLAATLVQDRQKDNIRAQVLLVNYLTHWPRPLEAEAMVRLARAQLGLGKRIEAQAIITKIIEKYPGTPSAFLARELRSELNAIPTE